MRDRASKAVASGAEQRRSLSLVKLLGATCLPAGGNHGPIYPSGRGGSWAILKAGVQVLARAGVASRRAAEEIIASGQVRVNGAVVLVPQHQVAESFDKVHSLATRPDPPDFPPVPGSPRSCWATERLSGDPGNYSGPLDGRGGCWCCSTKSRTPFDKVRERDTLARNTTPVSRHLRCLLCKKCSASRGKRLWLDSGLGTGAFCTIWDCTLHELAVVGMCTRCRCVWSCSPVFRAVPRPATSQAAFAPQHSAPQYAVVDYSPRVRQRPHAGYPDMLSCARARSWWRASRCRGTCRACTLR